jgi:AAA domain
VSNLDFKPLQQIAEEAAAQAPTEAGDSVASTSENKTPLDVLVEERRFNPALNPPPIRPVYSLGEIPICTPGNLATIVAAAKAGKTAFLESMIASVMKKDGADCDTFTVVSRNPDGRAVLHFDTEQSIEDHWHVIDRAMRRAGVTELPPWFRSYCFTGFDAPKARTAILFVLQEAVKKFGGVHSILIDGYADLVADVNDSAECTAFVAEFQDLAIQCKCPIVGVLHLNPGSEKSRGHLGSQLERKSETNLRLDKDGIYTEVWSEKQRRAPILKGRGPRFRWDDASGMHVSVETRREARQDTKTEAARNQVEDVFRERPSMRYCDLETTVQTLLKCQPRWAGKKIAEWEKLGVIEKGVAGFWIPKASV